MALSCPVIAADVPGACEQYGDAALLFSATDERGLAELILMLMRDDSIRLKQIARGKARIANLNGEHYATAVLNIVDEFTAVARAWERCDSVFI
jgi:glycosyltransferase involved in cell wall biosynthesis